MEGPGTQSGKRVQSPPIKYDTLMELAMTDLELSNLAKTAMKEHRYDDAISHLRKMNNQAISIKMELLVIEHEQAHELGKAGELAQSQQELKSFSSRAIWM